MRHPAQRPARIVPARPWGLLAALSLIASACASPQAPAGDDLRPAGQAGLYEVILRPELDENAGVGAIAVSARLTGGLLEGETRLRLSAPVVYVNVTGIADRILDLSVRDAAGPVGFTTDEDPPVPGGYPYFRHWTASREVTFPVEMTYRALVQPEGGPPGPAFGIRPSAGGVSGAGAGFMLVPANASASTSVLDWDLSGFAPGAVGVSTFGEGRVEVAGPPPALMQGWILAGHPGQYPEAGEESPLRAYWLGSFPFDAQAEMAYTKDLYDFLAAFFGYLDPPPQYRVFMRQLDTPPFGGATALANSFMLSRGPALPEEQGSQAPRATIAHELIHMWVGQLQGEHILTNWFSEGLTTYYEYTAPFRSGRVTIDDYIAGLNTLSERYYTNPARSLPAAEIGRIGFSDGRVRHTPYQRGALYFADLDARIRAASGGERTLDLFLRDVFTQRRSGELALTLAAWGDLVMSETGAEEAAFVTRVHIEGALMVPAPDAFGACVRGQAGELEVDGAPVPAMRWVRAQEVAPEACFEAGVR